MTAVIQCEVHNFFTSMFQSLAPVGHCMPPDNDVESDHDVPVQVHLVVKLLQQHMQDANDFDFH